jgi:hypothetical protein
LATGVSPVCIWRRTGVSCGARKISQHADLKVIFEDGSEPALSPSKH